MAVSCTQFFSCVSMLRLDSFLFPLSFYTLLPSFPLPLSSLPPFLTFFFFCFLSLPPSLPLFPSLSSPLSSLLLLNLLLVAEGKACCQLRNMVVGVPTRAESVSVDKLDSLACWLPHAHFFFNSSLCLEEEELKKYKTRRGPRGRGLGQGGNCEPSGAPSKTLGKEEECLSEWPQCRKGQLPLQGTGFQLCFPFWPQQTSS